MKARPTLAGSVLLVDTGEVAGLEAGCVGVAVGAPVEVLVGALEPHPETRRHAASNAASRRITLEPPLHADQG